MPLAMLSYASPVDFAHFAALLLEAMLLQPTLIDAMVRSGTGGNKKFPLLGSQRAIVDVLLIG